MSKKQKIIVGMSGGIDSSVTAYLLQKDGYEVEGLYMKLHDTVDGYHEHNINNIKKVCTHLDIKYHILDIRDKFKKEVYDYFVNSYIDGITPNPCVKCNKTIKFGAMIDKMKELGGDFLATGHYATSDGEFIYCAKDKYKDQSYFLAQVSKEALKFMMFPMSQYTKEYIVNMAKELPFLSDIAKQKESQEICFVPNVYTEILQKHTNIDLPGITLDKDGNEIGTHKGYMHYTVGKRKGFYVHGAHEPHFVISQDKKNNTITVGKKDELYVDAVEIDNLNMFINDSEFKAQVKLRYKSNSVDCNVVVKNNIAVIELQEKVFGVALGQVAVLYDDCKVVGSGYIINTKTS
jgi:tRNA-specific 2-thiouridylase